MTAVAIIVALLSATPSPSAASAAPAATIAPTPAATQMPAHGGAFVTTLPEGAEVWVDGRYAGRSPAFVDLLVPGKHAFTVARTGWQAQNASADVFGGRITMVALVLERSGAQTAASKGEGQLSVRGSPVGASVYIDGSKVGTLPIATVAKIKAGYHIVSVVPKIGDHLLRTVQVFPDTPTVVSIDLGLNQAGENAEVLAPAESYVPAHAIAKTGNSIVIRYRGIEVKCSIGSRSYTYNGQTATLAVAPALVEGKLYLPKSLLERIKPR